MELDEFHVEQFRTRVIREGNAVARAFPRIARHGIRAAKSASANDNGLGLENPKTAALAVVAERTGHAVAIFQQRHDGVFHVHRDALMNAVILQRADEFETRAVADVGETRITMTAEIALRNFSFLGAIKHRPPSFEFVNARRCFLGVQFGHAPVVDILAAAHRVGEMDLPIVAVVHIAHGRGHAAFGHDGVRLAEE